MMKCDGCTLCCKFPVIPEVNSKVNEYCKYCKENIGCEIYDKRPDSCRMYECMWFQMVKQNIDVADELRPDKCNVLFERYTDKVIVGTTDKKLSDLVLSQIKKFMSEGFSVLIVDYAKKSRTYYLAKGYDINFVKEQINGRTKLHRRPE